MSLFTAINVPEDGTKDRDGTRARVRVRDIVPVPARPVFAPECPASVSRLETLEQVSAVWMYDPLNGFLYWNFSNGRQIWTGKVVTTRLAGGYVTVIHNGFAYKAHRLAWLLHYRRWPEFEVDHINGLRADNRIANLRDVPHRVNQLNQSYHRAGTDRRGIPLARPARICLGDTP